MTCFNPPPSPSLPHSPPLAPFLPVFGVTCLVQRPLTSPLQMTPVFPPFSPLSPTPPSYHPFIPFLTRYTTLPNKSEEISSLKSLLKVK